MSKFYFLLLFLFTGTISFSQSWKVYPYKPAGSLISFPADEGRHVSEPIEWWYTAGHLTASPSGKTYSYMLTYFYYPASSYGGFRILDITDDATGKFYQDSKLVHYTNMATTHLDIQASVTGGDNESWITKTDGNNKLVPFEYSIQAGPSNAGLALDYKSLKRPLILADSGYLKEGLSNYTYYYSQTRNDVSGKLTLNGITENVTGTSWIDRQYGDFDRLIGEKYEWFLLQLSNGMDINVWNVFTAENKIPTNSKYRILSSYVNDSTQYTTSDFKIERLGFNWMPDSQMCYSNKWRLTSDVNKIDLTFSTKNNNNEVQSPFRFFEGATDISGTVNGAPVTGFGFAELLHSYQSPIPAIKYPEVDEYNIKIPITWQLMNPDDGMSVTYDLAYSIDDKISFQSIAESISDSSYLWNGANLANASQIWFKITAHSIDGKLQFSVISASGLKIVTEGSQKLVLFPNPVSDYLYFEPAFQTDNPPCRILDVSGHVVRIFGRNSLTNKIDVSFLPKVIYIFEIAYGEKRSTVKFIRN